MLVDDDRTVSTLWFLLAFYPADSRTVVEVAHGASLISTSPKSPRTHACRSSAKAELLSYLRTHTS
jgi:hypothetical protein